MEKEKENKEQGQQLKINFDVVERISLKCVYETKIISINNAKTDTKINSVLRQKIYKDIIDNSKSY